MAYFYVLDFARAIDEARLALQIYPRNVTFRSNYALFAMYNSDFTLAASEAKKVVESDAAFHKGYLPMAVAAIDAGDAGNAASAAYEQMAASGASGASLAAAGRGDLAIRLGRYADAVKVLEAGLAADLQAKRSDGAVAKYAALADAALRSGRPADARTVAAAAAALSQDLSAQVLAARALARGGDAPAAQKIAVMDSKPIQ